MLASVNCSFVVLLSRLSAFNQILLRGRRWHCTSLWQG